MKKNLKKFDSLSEKTQSCEESGSASCNTSEGSFDLLRFADEQSAQERLHRCMEQIAHGLDAFLAIAEPLRQIQQEKLFRLCLGRDGVPLYSNFGQFLNDVLNMGYDGYCKLCKASDTYKQLKEKFGDDTDARLASLKTLAGLYELSQIPQNRLVEAVEAITDDANHSPTAGDVRSWRSRTLPPDDGPRKRGRPRKAGPPATNCKPDGPVIDVDAIVTPTEGKPDVQASPEPDITVLTGDNVSTVIVRPFKADTEEKTESVDAVDENADDEWDTEEDIEEFEEEEPAPEPEPGELLLEQLCNLLSSSRLADYVARNQDQQERLAEKLESFWYCVGDYRPE